MPASTLGTEAAQWLSGLRLASLPTLPSLFSSRSSTPKGLSRATSGVEACALAELPEQLPTPASRRLAVQIPSGTPRRGAGSFARIMRSASGTSDDSSEGSAAQQAAAQSPSGRRAAKQGAATPTRGTQQLTERTAGEPAAPATPSKQRCKLLAKHPLLQPALQRQQWHLGDFELGERLHAGYASHVFKGRCLQSDTPVALKVYDTRSLDAEREVQLHREVELHASLVHSNVVVLHAAFKEAHVVVLVQEWCGGGDVATLMQKHPGGLCEVAAVQTVLRPLLSALVYLHARGITHRDIKPENLLLSQEGAAKLADFGLALDTTREAAVSCAGTLEYMAPEMVACSQESEVGRSKQSERAAYNSGVDVWSVGVLAFELLAGFPPFTSKKQQQVVKKIMTGQIEYPRHFSDGACSFLAAALTKDPAERPTAMELLHHSWMRIR